MEHYLDNSATTAVSKAAADKAYAVMTRLYGNPSSLHSKGIEAENELKNARKSVALRLRVSDGEITFTSGGTEANNLALFGAAYARLRERKKIIISAVEHSSVTEAAKRLEAEGFQVERIAPRKDGLIHPGGGCRQKHLACVRHARQQRNGRHNARVRNIRRGQS